MTLKLKARKIANEMNNDTYYKAMGYVPTKQYICESADICIEQCDRHKKPHEWNNDEIVGCSGICSHSDNSQCIQYVKLPTDDFIKEGEFKL